MATPLPTPKRRHVAPESPTTYVTSLMEQIEGMTAADVRQLMHQRSIQASLQREPNSHHKTVRVSLHRDRAFQVWLGTNGSGCHTTLPSFSLLSERHRKTSSWTASPVAPKTIAVLFPKTKRSLHLRHVLQHLTRKNMFPPGSCSRQSARPLSTHVVTYRNGPRRATQVFFQLRLQLCTRRYSRLRDPVRSLHCQSWHVS